MGNDAGGDTGLRVEIDDPVALITLDRPDTLNALTLPMLGAFREAVDAAAADPRVVGIVVTGAGRGFCSGLDASVLAQTASAGSSAKPTTSDVPGLFTWLLEIPKPVIAAVNGVAAGGGFVLAAMADLRIASTNGSFTTIFSKRGLIAEHGMTWTLPRLIGAGAALDLLWSSRRIDAAEAHRVGLVQQVVEPDDLLAACRRYVVDLAEQVSPASLADTKRLVYRHLGTAYPDALRETDEVQYAALDRVDAREGAAALIEKRPAQFPRLGEETE
jgi:enoyl-CoA hydratase/carnithine racemase